MADKPRGWVAVWRAMRTWRTASVTLLSFSSGLPLGLVWFAIPTWLALEGVDIKTIGLFTLVQAPWTFKFLWSPLMDRYALPLGMPRKLGWALLTQLLLFGLTLWLGGLVLHPDALWVLGALTLAIAFVSASQDIALDAYAVEVLRPEEQGVAVGARTALYRAAMFVAGGLAITIAGRWSWPGVFGILALAYLPMMAVTCLAPRSERDATPPPRTLRETVWEPFVGFLSTHRALEILAFVVFYKLADNLAQALVSPFLIDLGYGPDDRGFARTTIGMIGIVGGTFIGGSLTNVLGLGRSLWIFGFLQIVSNAGYALLADMPVHRASMFAAVGFESFTTGLGTGAFFVLLLRMTQKRFSATQYALFSSLFGVPRIIAGPITGFVVDAVGWGPFFWGTLAAGIPGMVLLARFVPWGERDPHFEIEPPRSRMPLTARGLAARTIAGGIAGLLVAALSWAALVALKGMRDRPDAPFDLAAPLLRLVAPPDGAAWIELAGVLVVATTCSLATAAVTVARHGK